MPLIPKGNQGPPPPVTGASPPPLGMFVQRFVSNLPDTSAAMKKKANTASDSTVTIAKSSACAASREAVGTRSSCFRAT